MLDRFVVNPILPAQDGNRARGFYRDVLGLRLIPSPIDDPMMFEAGAGTRLVITEIPERTPPPYAMVSFTVTDIDQLVRDLKERGVTFVNLGSATFQGRGSVVSNDVSDFGPVKSAWFKDTEGNILALNEVISLRQ